VKVVVYPHQLGIGGSQLNAIEIAAAVRDLGHEVIVFGQSGALIEKIAAHDLEFVAAPRPRGRPSPWVMRALNRLVRKRGIDVVHGYEWTTALEAYFGPRARHGVPAVATIMSMSVEPFVPYDMPVIVGTEQIADHEMRRGRPGVTVIEPPVDVTLNAPGAVDTGEFRRTYELDPDALTVVGVSRLAATLKLEGLLAAIDATPELAATAPMQLVLVGDGPNRSQVAERAARANARAGRRVVILTGELTDPRPAYAAADVCFGMGGSALRAMAFGHPVIVQGEQGFWELVAPQTVERFLWTGWYGVGTGTDHGRAAFSAIMRELLGDPGQRDRLGQYARRLVEQRFSLRSAGERQLAHYERAIATPIRAREWLAPASASACAVAAYRVRSRIGDVLGRVAADDSNSTPVAALSPSIAR
jgi:glycosyltransferase involved in cell wall biosynthesis